MMLGKYASIADCRTCDQEAAQSFKEAHEFFDGLVKQVQEQTNG